MKCSKADRRWSEFNGNVSDNIGKTINGDFFQNPKIQDEVRGNSVRVRELEEDEIHLWPIPLIQFTGTHLLDVLHNLDGCSGPGACVGHQLGLTKAISANLNVQYDIIVGTEGVGVSAQSRYFGSKVGGVYFATVFSGAEGENVFYIAVEYGVRDWRAWFLEVSYV